MAYEGTTSLGGTLRVKVIRYPWWKRVRDFIVAKWRAGYDR